MRHRRRGILLVEVLVALTILVISAAGIFVAFVSGAQITYKVRDEQIASMLANNLLEEIGRLPNFEHGRFSSDAFAGGGVSETGEAVAGPGDHAPRNRSAMDDKTDYHGVIDGAGVLSDGSFRSVSGTQLRLGTNGQPFSGMHRRAKVTSTNLSGQWTGDPALRVEVEVYDGPYEPGTGTSTGPVVARAVGIYLH